MNKNFSETQKISDLKQALKDVVISDESVEKSAINRVIAEAYDAMKEKGYNPVNQIVGYIISGDPTYITSYKDARKKISRIEQDELLEEIVNYYINNNL
ncbi:MAG: IreB family regulatory phosphoprotein [Clostridia bacterium]|nr:IreB family regulatory phosphoprotein [Clostridia bacterium]